MPKQRIIILALVVLTAFALLAFFADRACHIPRHRDALQISKAGGCFEFWINRYQAAWTGLIGAGAALFAAWLAWTAIQKQIKQQERATTISEISYWQQKGDQAEMALANIDLIELTLNLIVIEINEIKNRQNTSLAVIDSLRYKGNFPLQHTNAFLVGSGGYQYNHFVLVLDKLYSSTTSASPSTLIDIDRSIQLAFSHIPAILSDVAKSRARHEKIAARATRTLEKLEEMAV